MCLPLLASEHLDGHCQNETCCCCHIPPGGKVVERACGATACPSPGAHIFKRKPCQLEHTPSVTWESLAGNRVRAEKKKKNCDPNHCPTLPLIHSPVSPCQSQAGSGVPSRPCRRPCLHPISGGFGAAHSASGGAVLTIPAQTNSDRQRFPGGRAHSSWLLALVACPRVSREQYKSLTAVSAEGTVPFIVL